jgi:ABC-type branched-subunit amino acid transport system ATPase component/ABC-type branched-subunit amino acid transport system permease subunit
MSKYLGLALVRHGGLALVALAVMGLFWMDQGFPIYMATLALVYGLLAVALSLYTATGLLDLGFAAFFAIGAYGVVIGFRQQLPALPVLLLICLVNAALAVFLAFVAGRSRGDYFAVVTLAFGEMIRIVIRNESALTGGPQGLSLPPGQSWAAWMAGEPRRPLLVIGTVALFGAGLAQRVLRSATGYAALFCREREEYFRLSALSPLRVRLKMAILGSLLATAAGVFFGTWQGYVSPSSFNFFESLIVLVIVILGAGTRAYIPGVLLAAGLVIVVPELLKTLGEYRMLLFGVLVLMVTLLLPTGLLGLDWARWENLALQSRQRPASARKGTPSSAGGLDGESHDLVVAGVSAGYTTSKFPVLHEFSYRFMPYQLHALIGYNGSGKTTLLRAILSSPDLKLYGGRVAVGHREIRLGWPRGSVASPLLGACLQRLSLVPYLSTYQHAMAIAGTSFDHLRSHCEEISARLSLGWDRLFVPVIELSSLDRRLAELLLALLRDPAVLLLDEPMAGFSSRESDRYYGSVRAFAAGRVVIFIEHAQKIVRKHADKVLFIANGSLARADDALPAGASLEPDPAGVGWLAAGRYDDVVALEIVQIYLGSHSTSPEHVAPDARRARKTVLRTHIRAAGYPGAPAVLREVRFEAAAGDLVFFTGLNGAGKSTLLRVLGRRPEVAIVNGEATWRPNSAHELDLFALPPHALATAGLAMVLDGARVFPSMTVQENLHPGRISGRRFARNLATEFLRGPLGKVFFGHGGTPTEVEISDILRKPGEALSGGQQQAVAVIRAIIHARHRLEARSEHALMLLDEPSSGIQQVTVRSIYQAIAELHDAAPDRFLLVATEQNRVFEEILPGATTAVLFAGEPLSLLERPP